MNNSLFTCLVLLWGSLNCGAISPWLAPDLEPLKAKAKSGDMDAHYRLAQAYLGGMGVETNHAEAMKWLQPALDKEYDKAQNLYGYMFHHGCGVTQDFAKAHEWYLKAAKQGNYKAAANIGRMYNAGEGVPKNWETGESWLQASFILMQKTAEGGHPDDQSNLGWRYFSGEGLAERNLKESFKWYSKAAAQGFPRAEYWVGIFHLRGYVMEKNPAEAARWMRLAAEHGDINGMARLGLWHLNGNLVSKDYQAARKWLGMAADAGHVDAQLDLAHLQTRSDYPDPQDRDGLKRVKPLAEAGNANAMELYGLMCYYGRGAPASKSESFLWYHKAAEAGRRYAQYWTGQCLHKGKGTKKDMAQAIEWYRKAARNGEYHAQLELGHCYESGLGVPIDLIEAHKWFTLAGKTPSTNVGPLLENLQKKINPEQIQESQRRVRLFEDGIDVKPGEQRQKEEELDLKKLPFDPAGIT